MMLSTLILIPLITALFLAVIKGINDVTIRKIGLASALLSMILTIIIALNFNPSSTSTLQLIESYPWIEAFGVNFSLGVDGISLVLIALANVLVPVVMLAGWNESLNHKGTVRQYVVLTLITQAMMVGVFAAADVFLFYVFFEAILIPMYFLIGRFGGQRSTYAAVKFLLYSLVGGLLMLASLIGLWVVSRDQLGEGTFDWQTLTTLTIDPT
ncbi:MAG: complex I subunit 4 family protein, partial [Candidatus Nanopelagicales bacterium]